MPFVSGFPLSCSKTLFGEEVQIMETFLQPHRANTIEIGERPMTPSAWGETGKTKNN
jgi:hypothetical protein